ncbi:MAG: hypothetical protein AAGJ37_17190 [Pseudomonadota bacterium]
MVTTTFTDVCLLSAEQQVVLHEKNFSSKGGTRASLVMTRAALNREYERNTLSTQEYVELSRRLSSLYNA